MVASENPLENTYVVSRVGLRSDLVIISYTLANTYNVSRLIRIESSSVVA